MHTDPMPPCVVFMTSSISAPNINYANTIAVTRAHPIQDTTSLDEEIAANISPKKIYTTSTNICDVYHNNMRTQMSSQMLCECIQSGTSIGFRCEHHKCIWYVIVLNTNRAGPNPSSIHQLCVYPSSLAQDSIAYTPPSRLRIASDRIRVYAQGFTQ